MSATFFRNSQPLPIAQPVRYLTIHIDRRLTWLPHIKNKVQSLNNRLRILRPLLTSKNIKLPNKLLIYKILLWSHLDIHHTALGRSKTAQHFKYQSYPKSLV